MRRVLVRLQRLLALEPGSLMRLLHRPPQWLREQDVQALRQFHRSHRSPAKPFKPVPDGFEIDFGRKVLPAGEKE